MRRLIALLALVASSALAAPGDTLIRSNLGQLIPNPDQPPAPILILTFPTPGNYASGTSFGVPPTAVTFTRSSTALYDNGGTLTTAAANRLRVESGGALIEVNSTNYTQQSGSVCSAATTFQSPWTNTAGLGPSCTANNVTLAPDGVGYYDEITIPAGADGSVLNRRLTGSTSTASSTLWSASAWLATTSGTAPVIIGVLCSGAASASYVSCWTSTGLSCGTAGIGAGSSVNGALVTLTTQPVRVSAHVTCSTSQTATFVLNGNGIGGPYPVRIWGAQLERTLTYSTSYIPTTTTAVTRQIDTATFPNPVGGTDFRTGAWCYGVDAAPGSGGDWVSGVRGLIGTSIYAVSRIDIGGGTVISGVTYGMVAGSTASNNPYFRESRTAVVLSGRSTTTFGLGYDPSYTFGACIPSSAGEGRAKLWVNGTNSDVASYDLCDGAPMTGTTLNATMTLGKSGSATVNYFNGNISRVRVWRAACTKVGW